MKVSINTRQLPTVERLKAKAFCIKVSCDSMVEVPKQYEDMVESMEDFAEEVFELLTKATSQTPVDKLLAGGVLTNSPKDCEKAMNEIMSLLDSLVKESRKAMDLPAELLYTKLFSDGLCDDKKKEESAK